MNSSFDFATVGDNCIDRYKGSGNSELVGGNALNVAAQLSLLGHKVAYFGAVGNDPDGELIIRELNRVGVCTKYIKIVHDTTAYSLIRHDERGDRDIYFEEFGASGTYLPNDEELAIIARAGHVHIGWMRDGSAVNHRLKKLGVSVSRDLSVNSEEADLDPNGLDIAVVSANSPEEAQEKASDLLRSGAGLALVTIGEHGSFASDGKSVISISSSSIEPVDTTGAGDSFIAGFLSAYKNNQDLETSLKSGRKLATGTCLRVGGFPQNTNT